MALVIVEALAAGVDVTAPATMLETIIKSGSIATITLSEFSELLALKA